MEELLKKTLEKGTEKTPQEARQMAPLVLAYMGDALFEVYIRNYLIGRHAAAVNELHRRATTYVKARSQSDIVHALETELSEEEWWIVKRGRNQKPATVPKNALLSDYLYATGFEALLGYLYYVGRIDRLMELMEKSVEIINQAGEPAKQMKQKRQNDEIERELPDAKGPNESEK